MGAWVTKLFIMFRIAISIKREEENLVWTLRIID